MTDHNAKDRLYLALYYRDGFPTDSQSEDRFHWALLNIPGAGHQATRFHARDHFVGAEQTHWLYEEIHVPIERTQKLLSRTYLGDVDNNERLLEIVRDVLIEQRDGWNCRSWVETAVALVWHEGLVDGGTTKELNGLKDEALTAADTELAKKENTVKAML